MRERSGPGLAEDIDENLLEEAEEGEDRSYLKKMVPPADNSTEPIVQIKEPKEEPADTPPGSEAGEYSEVTEPMEVKKELEEENEDDNMDDDDDDDDEGDDDELEEEEEEEDDDEEEEDNCGKTVDENGLASSSHNVKRPEIAMSLVENFVSELDSERNMCGKYSGADKASSGVNMTSTYLPGSTDAIERITQQLTANLDRLTEEYKSTSTKLNNNDINSKITSSSANNAESDKPKNTTANLPVESKNHT